MKNNKKGEFGLNAISGAIIALLFIAIVFGLTFQFSDKFKEGIADTTASVADELISNIVNGTTYTLTANYTGINCWDKNYFSIDSVRNLTGTQDLIDSGNYTYSKLGTITPNSEYALSTTDTGWYINYTYKYSDREICGAVENTTNAVATVPTWLVIIVLILVATIILGLLGKFGGNKTTAQI